MVVIFIALTVGYNARVKPKFCSMLIWYPSNSEFDFSKEISRVEDVESDSMMKHSRVSFKPSILMMNSDNNELACVTKKMRILVLQFRPKIFCSCIRKSKPGGPRTGK